MQLKFFLWWVNPKEFNEKQIKVVTNLRSFFFSEWKEWKLRGRDSHEQNNPLHHHQRSLPSFFKYIHIFFAITLLFLCRSVEILELISPLEALEELVLKGNSDNISDWQTFKKYGSVVKIRFSALLCGRSQGPLQVMHSGITLPIKQAQRPFGYSSCLTRQYNAMGCRQSKVDAVRSAGILMCLENSICKVDVYF